MRVIMDTREPDAMRTLFLAEDDLSIALLPCGDYLVENRWLFERKTIVDLCRSLSDGRLFRQAIRMLQSEYQLVYVIEGGAAQFSETGMRREAIQGAMVTLTLFFGLPVLRSLTGEETVRLMRYAAEQGVRQADGVVSRSGYRPKGRRARQLYVLQGLPGVGRKRAAGLLDRFGGVEAVMSAGEDELAEVPGIGYPTARAIRRVVEEESECLMGWRATSARIS